MRTTPLAIALGAGTLLALAAAPLAASAHVGADATSTAAGSYAVVTFSVPHGCDGSPTTEIRISLPEDIPSVTPTVNPNWTISRTLVPLDPPTEDQSERTSEVIYTAITPLPADERDTFELSLKLPDGEAGDVVEFPVLQTCAEGTVEWIGDEVPSITLTAAVEGDEHDHATGSTTEAHDHSADESAATAETAAVSSDDIVARVLGGIGLVLGAAALVVAVTSRRKAAN
jgi:uncharacterized protein YcnI